jgi:uncharacterized membrane protein
MIWLEAIFHVIHVLAAVCWIGGLYLLIRAVRPVLLQGDDASKNYALMRTIQKKFLVLAGMMLMTLVITGLGNLYFTFHRYEYGAPPGNWMIIMTIKLILVMGLFVIYGINLMASLQSKGNPDNLSKPPTIRFAKTALILGFLIIALGVLLHTGVAY